MFAFLCVLEPNFDISELWRPDSGVLPLSKPYFGLGWPESRLLKPNWSQILSFLGFGPGCLTFLKPNVDARFCCFCHF